MSSTFIYKEKEYLWQPYTYIIGWSRLKKYYYGVKYGKDANPELFWVNYKTSSKDVNTYVKEHGDPDIIKITRVFNTAEEARYYEERAHRKFNVASNEFFINKASSNYRGDEHKISCFNIQTMSKSYVGLDHFNSNRHIYKANSQYILVDDEGVLYLGEPNNNTRVRVYCIETGKPLDIKWSHIPLIDRSSYVLVPIDTFEYYDVIKKCFVMVTRNAARSNRERYLSRAQARYITTYKHSYSVYYDINTNSFVTVSDQIASSLNEKYVKKSVVDEIMKEYIQGTLKIKPTQKRKKRRDESDVLTIVDTVNKTLTRIVDENGKFLRYEYK